MMISLGKSIPAAVVYDPVHKASILEVVAVSSQLINPVGAIKHSAMQHPIIEPLIAYQIADFFNAVHVDGFPNSVSSNKRILAMPQELYVIIDAEDEAVDHDEEDVENDNENGDVPNPVSPDYDMA